MGIKYLQNGTLSGRFPTAMQSYWRVELSILSTRKDLQQVTCPWRCVIKQKRACLFRSCQREVRGYARWRFAKTIMDFSGEWFQSRSIFHPCPRELTVIETANQSFLEPRHSQAPWASGSCWTRNWQLCLAHPQMSVQFLRASLYAQCKGRIFMSIASFVLLCVKDKQHTQDWWQITNHIFFSCMLLCCRNTGFFLICFCSLMFLKV